MYLSEGNVSSNNSLFFKMCCSIFPISGLARLCVSVCRISSRMEPLMFGKQGVLTEGKGPVLLTNLIKVACFVKKINNIFVTSASFCH